MTDAFEFAVGKILAFEGGYVQAAGDSGGRTIYGISETSNPGAWKNGPPSLEQAKQIYRDRYWTPAGCDFLPLPVALVVFDCAVNSGVTEAVTMLQRLVGSPVDGRMGPATISKVRKYADRLVAEAYLAARKGFYEALALAHPEDQKFLLGWLNRVQSLTGELQNLA